MLQHQLHVGGLAQDAHVGQDAVIHQIVRSRAVAAIFFALKFAPLRFLDLAANRAENDVALQLDPGFQQRFHRVHVAHQRAFHVVNAEAVDHAVFDDGVGLVADAGKEILVAGVRGIHVAIEHQALAVAVAFKAADDVGSRVFNLLPRDLRARAC